MKLSIDRTMDADREQICNLASIAHKESLFSNIAFSRTKFFKAFDKTIEEPSIYLGLKVTLGNEIVGFCYALLGDYYIGSGAKVVTVITIATAPRVRSSVLGGKVALRLTKGVEIWAKSMAANYILYHATSGINPTSTDRFFRKIGMTSLGGNYGIRLSNTSASSG